MTNESRALDLPAGFRFHPTDEELVMHYLCRKCASQTITAPVIAEVDLYKFDPWKLPALAMYGEKEWYFSHQGIGNTQMVQGQTGLLGMGIGRQPVQISPLGGPKYGFFGDVSKKGYSDGDTRDD